MSQAMTATTDPRQDARGRRTSFADALRSEWTKLRTLRPAIFALLAAVTFAVGFSALFSLASVREASPLVVDDQPTFDPTATSLNGYLQAQGAIALVGVLIVTSEYATGTIQASLAAVARRGRLLAAKATMATIVALTVGELAGFGMFFTGQAALAAQGGPHTSLDQPHVLRAVVGAGLYLAVVALLGVAVGTLIRSTAAALATMVSVTLLIPAMSGLLPASWARLVGKFWPTVAGSQVMAVHHDPASALGPWAGFGLLCAFAAVVLTAALVAFRYRDA